MDILSKYLKKYFEFMRTREGLVVSFVLLVFLTIFSEVIAELGSFYELAVNLLTILAISGFIYSLYIYISRRVR